jgi:hypothetical protein
VERSTGASYSWAAGGFKPPVPPDLFHAELSTLGRILERRPTPEDIVKAAEALDHPLHICFQWDDADAAAAHRRDQAADLIRHLRVTFTRGPARDMPMRAFVSVTTDGHRGYVATDEALADAGLRAQLLTSALREFVSFAQKYRVILISIGAEDEATALLSTIERAAASQ